MGTTGSEQETIGGSNESKHGKSSQVSSNACIYCSRCLGHTALDTQTHTVLSPCNLRTPPACLCSLRSMRTPPGTQHGLTMNKWGSTIIFPTCKMVEARSQDNHSPFGLSEAEKEGVEDTNYAPDQNKDTARRQKARAFIDCHFQKSRCLKD